jgi:hypothetical protein
VFTLGAAAVAYVAARLGIVLATNAIVGKMTHLNVNSAYRRTPLIQSGTANLIGLVFAAVAALALGQTLWPAARKVDDEDSDTGLDPPSSK